MSLTALLEVKFKPEALEEATAVFKRALNETRAFDGCESVEVLVDAQDPTRWVILERWASVEQDAKYREFRAGEGAITELGPLLAGAPSLTSYHTDDSI
ncbi:antibiotic biosynthesis monooxygenase [Williamsia sp. 1135]|jgi:quinol monooxygenase YgiN|uniref:putative quinol monooxygenase n=1 Tax=Williamsia sp. 1135 TaxID=1889262 RepID=UPI000A10CAEE|nr:antibiotic biosynthesis monooxygenase [Williamsia sp. 1135]ORM34925.1 antibiotic biosynthesis monooxygenase [Williamsia sp. 1135]